MRTKTCKECCIKFKPERPLAVVCSWECGLKYNITLKQKRVRKEKKELNENDIAVLKRLAQTLVNKYIRLRDIHQPCISCGFKGDSRQWHAGHYMPMGNNGSIRYHEDNIHKQCSICNNHLSGNLANYRINLITRIGLEKVEWLESEKNPKKWTKEELQEIISTYKQKIKEAQ